MRQFRTDEEVNQREAQIRDIQRLQPEFNPVGKSDNYIQAYHDALLENYLKKAASRDSKDKHKDKEKNLTDIVRISKK